MLNAVKNVKKKAWIVIGVAATLVLSCAGVVWVDYGHVGEEEKRIADLEVQISKADARIAKIPSIEERVLRGRVVVKEYAKILPNDKDINRLVKRITEFSVASGVEIEELNDSDARNRGRRKSKDPFQKIRYKLKLRGTLDELLDFMNRFENYERFVKVGQVKITSEDARTVADAPQGPVKHKVELDLETYVYEPGRSSEPVAIKNADRRTIDILERQPVTNDLELDHYELVVKTDRRDPFVDPRRDASIGAGEEALASAQAEAQAKKMNELASTLAQIKKAVDEESKIEGFVPRVEFARRLSQKMAEFAAEIEELQTGNFFSSAKTRDRFVTEIADPFELLYRARKSMGKGVLVRQELENQLKNMRRAFEEGRFEDIVAAAETIGGTKATNVEDPEIAEILSEIEAVSGRAQARIEFSQIPLAITGYVYMPRYPVRSVVIINDQAYSPGEVLDDGIVVRSIDPSRVVFVYKTERIEHLLN